MRERQLYYDVESFPNFFMVTCRIRTENSVENQNFFADGREEAKAWFADKDMWQVGFNSANYDDVMISYWLCDEEKTDEQMYEMNDYLINDIATPAVRLFINNNVSEFKFKKFGQERVNRTLLPYAPALKSLGGNDRKAIDLYTLGEKSGSLKNAATVLGVNSLVETPVEFGTALTDNQIDGVVKYCQNDVDVTELCYNYYETIMQVRDEFMTKYNIKNAHNIGSAKLAEKYLIHTFRENSTRERLQEADEILDKRKKDPDSMLSGCNVSHLLKDYEYKFKDTGMKKLYDMISQSYLSFKPISTKGVDIWTDEAVDFDGWRKKSKEPSAYYINGQAVPKGLLMFADDRQNVYKFGIGGLHNDAPKGKWSSNDEMVIFNVDVTSYYPSLISANGFAPDWMPEFSDYITTLLADRRIAKAAGRKIESDAKKLVLNSSFGKTKDKYSPLYEPTAHFSVTLNGQLLLLKLIEMIHGASSTAKLLNANTDGVCFYTPRKDLDAIRAVCKAWEVMSRVELEEDIFDVWFQSTCNGYCAKQDNGSIKSKGGDFKLKPSALKETFAKSPALKKAMVHYVLNDVPIIDTLKSLHPSEFCMTKNFGKATQLIIDDKPVDKKVLRYAYAKNGKPFTQHRASDGRVSVIGKNRDLIMVDVLSDVSIDDIDLKLYEQDAKEMILDVAMERKSKCLPAKVRRDIDDYFIEWESEQ